MARPHCKFIQNQSLPWDNGILPATRTSLPTRLLSQDPDTGALTAIVQLPPGWHPTQPNCLDADEECLVLGGSLEINNKPFGPISYACLPADYKRHQVAGPDGATVLVMLSANAREYIPVTPDYDTRKLILNIDPAAEGLETWTENPYTRYLVGTGVRPLREDPDSGEISIFYSALPFRYMAKRWTHPVVQEMFVLVGEYAINDVGLMCPGAYAWWAPNEWHGPYGSLRGFMMFIRTHGGPLANNIAEEEIAVDYAPSYNPKLPESLAQYAIAPQGSTLF